MLGATAFLDEDKYEDCEKFSVSCPSCKHLNVISTPFIDLVCGFNVFAVLFL